MLTNFFFRPSNARKNVQDILHWKVIPVSKRKIIGIITYLLFSCELGNLFIQLNGVHNTSKLFYIIASWKQKQPKYIACALFFGCIINGSKLTFLLSKLYYQQDNLSIRKRAY